MPGARSGAARGDGARHSEIGLWPNAETTLTVRLHPLANQGSDDAVRHLCAALNRTELCLVYELASSHNG